MALFRFTVIIVTTIICVLQDKTHVMETCLCITVARWHRKGTVMGSYCTRIGLALCGHYGFYFIVMFYWLDCVWYLDRDWSCRAFPWYCTPLARARNVPVLHRIVISKRTYQDCPISMLGRSRIGNMPVLSCSNTGVVLQTHWFGDVVCTCIVLDMCQSRIVLVFRLRCVWIVLAVCWYSTMLCCNRIGRVPHWSSNTSPST